MSRRSDSLADRIETRSRELTGFLMGLTEADLRAATEDPGGRSAGEVVAHLGEGYPQVLAWLGRAAQDPPGADGDSAGGGAGADGDSAGGGAGADGDPAGGGAGDVDGVVRQLARGGTQWAALVRGLTDEQLDRVPPAAPGYTDGRRTLDEIVNLMLDHQAAHLSSIRRAVAASGDLPRPAR